MINLIIKKIKKFPNVVNIVWYVGLILIVMAVMRISQPSPFSPEDEKMYKTNISLHCVQTYGGNAIRIEECEAKLWDEWKNMKVMDITPDYDEVYQRDGVDLF